MLAEIIDVPEDQRGAQFTAVMAIFDPKKEKIRTCQGIYRGKIIREMRGNVGFGFDSIFYNGELNKTNAEMTKEEKIQSAIVVRL
jgi:XTP/dITP diphosphohydrolase